MHFRDLNNACPKDDFPLPITELLMDATTGFDALSFMDGFSGYDQIKMNPEDKELTAFRTAQGTYCYTVMLFGLNKCRGHLSKSHDNYFSWLFPQPSQMLCWWPGCENQGYRKLSTWPKRVFERLCMHQLKMNPLKCAFGVTSGKFLGFVVRKDGIEIDPDKVKAIIQMPPPRNLRELRGLQGRLAYIRCFISNLSRKVSTFHKTSKEGYTFHLGSSLSKCFW